MDELDSIINEFTRRFGPGSAVRMTELPDTGVTGWTSTGSSEINEIISRPGIPDGRVTLICGLPSSGKTTLATHIMAEHQRRGGIPFYWSTEYSYDPDRARRIGLDESQVILGQPSHLEEAFEMLIVVGQRASSSKPALIVWDTFSATPTYAEIYGTGQEAAKREKDDVYDTEVSARSTALGEHSRIASKGMRKCQGLIDRGNVTLVVVLQSKQKIGVMWGSQETYLAERVWNFYSNVTLHCRYADKIKSGQEDIGIKMRVTCKKNKVGPPFRQCLVDCLFENGLDNAFELLDKAIRVGFVKVVSKRNLAYTAGNGEEVKFSRAGKKGLNWKDLLQQVSGLREYVEKLELSQGG